MGPLELDRLGKDAAKRLNGASLFAEILGALISQHIRRYAAS